MLLSYGPGSVLAYIQYVSVLLSGEEGKLNGMFVLKKKLSLRDRIWQEFTMQKMVGLLCFKILRRMCSHLRTQSEAMHI